MTKVSSGVVHDLSQEMKKSILADQEVHTKWESLTPLARNEYICWVTSAKKQETQEKRIKWMCEDLKKGKRRPCCWPGCPHRNKK